MRIVIETIPHNQQRYETVGDWYYTADETLHIKVSELSNWRREALIGLHELVEVLLCKHKGITQDEVDKFDMEFEKNRQLRDTSEPGDQPTAPYYHQHQFTSLVERQIARELEVNWEDYANEVSTL